MKKSAKKVNGKDFIVKNRILIGIAMMVAAVAFGLFLLPNVVNSAKTTYEVLVATVDIEVGTALTEDMYTIKKIADATEASKCYQATDDIVGFKAVSKIEKDGVLTKEAFGNKAPSNASDNTSTSPDIVPQDKQLIGVKVPSLSAGVSFGLKAGDVIRFYAAEEDKIIKQKIVKAPTELQYVEIYGVYDSSGMDCSKTGGAPASLTLIVSEEQAKKVVEITNNADTYFVLMSSGDLAKKAQFLKMQEDALKPKNSSVTVPTTQTPIEITTVAENNEQ